VLHHGKRSNNGLLTGAENGVLGESRDRGRLVAGGVDELVVEDLDLGVLAGELNNLVGNGLGIGEARNVLANTSKVEDDLLGVGTLELGAALVTKDDKVEVGLTAGGGPPADETGETGVDTTAKALVGAADNDELLFALTLERLGLGGLEDLVAGLAVLARVLHGALGAVELGRGDDLHGVGDLLDVANRLETALDFTEGGEGGRARSCRSAVLSQSAGRCITTILSFSLSVSLSIDHSQIAIPSCKSLSLNQLNRIDGVEAVQSAVAARCSITGEMELCAELYLYLRTNGKVATYLEAAARRAGRAALDSIVKGFDLTKVSEGRAEGCWRM